MEQVLILLILTRYPIICRFRPLKKLRLAEIDGKLPKVLVPVHMCGQSRDMEAIKKLSGIYGFKILEDASHAIGGQYLDGMMGSCNFRI